jgi:uncharacterized protein YodC (DUF2158 family)
MGSITPELEPGDVVRFRSGGPEMTIENIDVCGMVATRPQALCKWFEGKQLKEHLFEFTSLEKVR